MKAVQLINWPSIVGMLRRKFQDAQPFPHIVLDNFLDLSIAKVAESVFPKPSDAIWYEYENPLEKKLACNDLAKMPKPLADIIESLNDSYVAKLLSQISGINGLMSDPLLHGGGLHCITSGGKLDIRLDYSIHPKTGLERRVNLIIFLNKRWKKEYGGYLEFWDDQVKHCIKKVAPIYNRAIIFRTSDVSYHGHPEPLTCPPEVFRKSLALYFMTEPRIDTKQRHRVLFVKRPNDPDSEELDRLRKLRSGLDTAKDVYKIN